MRFVDFYDVDIAFANGCENITDQELDNIRAISEKEAQKQNSNSYFAKSIVEAVDIYRTAEAARKFS